MELAFLSASDPPPSRDDPRFGDDYQAFRKAYKAWNERERTRRKAVQPPLGKPAGVGQAAVHQAEATPVKRRRMLPRPNRADFDTERFYIHLMRKEPPELAGVHGSTSLATSVLPRSLLHADSGSRESRLRHRRHDLPAVVLRVVRLDSASSRLGILATAVCARASTSSLQTHRMYAVFVPRGRLLCAQSRARAVRFLQYSS